MAFATSDIDESSTISHAMSSGEAPFSVNITKSATGEGTKEEAPKCGPVHGGEV